MNKKFFYSLLAIGLMVLGTLIISCEKERKGIAKAEKPPKIEEVEPLRNAIEIKAEGEVLHYQRESLWGDEDFSKLLELKEESEAKEIDFFRKTLKKYNRHAVTPKIKLDESKKSAVFICDIKGAKEGSWFDFDWFLRPYSLDFIDSHFERREKELYWEGEVQGVKTTISIKFPFPISNCHEHVWPAR
ncbi:MAG: hypothetical protein U9P49_05350 [Thermodesulfobacteriota bacterium]|nr:hypothetical protein [Thermodesulfobacteriota bacterium]